VPSNPAASPRRGLGLSGHLVCGAGICGYIGAFLPEPHAWTAVPALLAFLALVEGARTFKQVVLALVVFGALGVGAGYHWLADTVQRFGGLSVPVSYAAAAAFGVAGTVHLVIAALFLRGYLSRGVRPHPFVAAALCVACESLPIRFFPWLIGHGAVDVAPVRQAAEWGGVPGVSLVVCCLVFPLRDLWLWARPNGGPPARPKAALLTLSLGVALFLVGWWRHDAVRADDAAADERLRVAIVQANVGSFAKRAEEEDRAHGLKTSVERYRKGSFEAASAGARLVVLPETAISARTNFLEPKPEPRITNSQMRNHGFEWLEQVGAERAFLIGAYESSVPKRRSVTGEPPDERYNVAALRQPGGFLAPWSVYRKVHLIPFGETMPFGLPRDLLPQQFVMKAASLPQDPLTFEGLTIAPFICYEAIVADHVRALCAGRRPDLLVNLTNDSWFTGLEPYEHLNFSRFRAVEHRVPLVRSTNTGISAFVDAAGEVVSRLGVDEEGILVHDVPLVDRPRTLYVRWGWALPWALGALFLVAFVFGRGARRDLSAR
jgi:apolipoprotein N-acyltransferase